MLTAVDRAVLCADYAARVKQRKTKRNRERARDMDAFTDYAYTQMARRRQGGRYIKRYVLPER